MLVDCEESGSKMTLARTLVDKGVETFPSKGSQEAGELGEAESTLLPSGSFLRSTGTCRFQDFYTRPLAIRRKVSLLSRSSS
jgi:hypothetical protein